jgi:transketolase
LRSGAAKSSQTGSIVALPAGEEALETKSHWVRRETLRIHHLAPETRIASSLSDVEIFVALYYGGILSFNPTDPRWEGRDRFIVSKGHGGVSLYPILADLGFFDPRHLTRVCRTGSFLGAIPDMLVPGFETINGSLGQGLGVACGMACGLKQKKSAAGVYVLVGDGELCEGSVWEAVMFAAHHHLDNLTLIVDSNKKSMLGYCSGILNLLPLEEKFAGFGWDVATIDGHDVHAVHAQLGRFKASRQGRPKVLVANTVKGKGVPLLEQDALCHVRTLNAQEALAAMGEAK